MNTFKSVWIAWLLALLGGTGILRAADATPPEPAVWKTDYAGALTEAKASHKLVLLDFTGSDWCVWCHRLDKEIFSKPAFADYARRHLALVKVDFPVHTAQAPALAQQNRRLADQFHVTGYPTIVVVDDKGRECGRIGYIEGGAKTFVRELQRFAAATN